MYKISEISNDDIETYKYIYSKDRNDDSKLINIVVNGYLLLYDLKLIRTFVVSLNCDQ